MFKNKLLGFSIFNLIMFLLIRFANDLRLETILNPDAGNAVILLFIYWSGIMPKVVLVMLGYCLYKLIIKKTVNMTLIIIMLINIFLVYLYIYYGMSYNFLH